MKYKAVTPDKATQLLGQLRAGEELGDGDFEARGEGDSIPSATMKKLGKELYEHAKNAGYPHPLTSSRDPAGGRFEAEACATLHQLLPFDPNMMADYDFWTWLAIEHHELVDWRHGGKSGMALPANFGIGERRENLFYRMWLRADIGRNESKGNPYVLAQRGDQDFWRSHVLRVQYGMCKTLVHAFLNIQFPNDKGKQRWSRSEVREVAKRLRKANATLFFESLDEGAAWRLIEHEAKASEAGPIS